MKILCELTLQNLSSSKLSSLELLVSNGLEVAKMRDDLRQMLLANELLEQIHILQKVCR